MQIKIQKNGWKLIRYGFIVFFVCLFLPKISHAEGAFDYHLLETFPGFYAQNDIVRDFPEFILSIYKFGIWTIGIAGLFMLTVGGFMYMSSAGNNSTATNAKGIIQDAIIGIIAALCAYLVMYIINPDLIELKISFTASPVAYLANSTPNVPGGGASTGPFTSHSNIINAAVAMSSCVYNQQQRNSCTGNPGYTDCSNFVCTSFKNAGCVCPGNVSSDYGAVAQAITDKSSLKAGDVLWVPGHVVICKVDGCNVVIGAAGVGKNIKDSNGSYYITELHAKVVRASNYCSS